MNNNLLLLLFTIFAEMLRDSIEGGGCDRMRAMSRKRLFISGFVVLGLSLLVFGRLTVRAVDPVEKLQQEIDELSKLKQMSESATENLEEELDTLQGRIKSVGYQLDQADLETKEIEKNIIEREDDLAETYQLLSLRVRSFYKLSRQFSPIMALLSADSAADFTKQLSYRSAATSQDRQAIIETTKTLLGLEEDKEALEQRKLQLAGLRAEFEKNAAFFAGEIKGAKEYQAELSQQIAELSARQKEILASKSSTFQTTVGDVPLADDPASRPDYNPGFSPAFAAFSFGAPHYKGMSQYGAFGRAKSGQSKDDILRAYYGNVRIETKDMPGSINTSVGTLSFEDNYLKGIAEMPSSWGDEGGMEALKAQAIAARTYALSYVGWRIANPNAGGSICTTEQCQVYLTSKLAAGGKWHEAVAATRGQVVVSNNTNEIFATWYASTSGGYMESYSSLGHSTPGFWDTSNGRSGWTSQAWEKVGGSPWFYKGWYKSRSGDACGRSHPWLNPTEMADVLNAWVVLFEGGGDSSRVTPIGSCWGGNPYSMDELRSIGGYSSVSEVSVTYADNGVTASVTFQTNKGSTPAIGGADFKKAFNLRAPGRIAIKSGLFNIEKK